MNIIKLPELNFTSLNVGHLLCNQHIGCIELNRPDKSNAFDVNLWSEFPKVNTTGYSAYAPLMSCSCIPTFLLYTPFTHFARIAGH
jgi:hypothetical protein